MKNLTILCLTLCLTSGIVLAQTKPATKPKTTTRPVTPGTKPYTPPATTTETKTVTTPKTTTTTKPATTTAPAQPAATETQVTQDMQEQYDKMNGTKPATINSTKTSKSSSSSNSKTSTAPAERSSKGTSDADAYRSRPTERAAKVKSQKEARRPSDASKFHIGFRGGVNLSTLAESGKFATDSLTNNLGFHGGLVLNIGGQGFSVQPEILFSQIGYKTKIVGSKISATVNTITVPVLLKVGIGGDAFRFNISAGGYGSYYLGGTAKDAAGASKKITFGADDARLEYGVAGGAGLQFGSKMKFFVDGRYYYSLGDNAKKVAGSTDPFFGTRSIMVSAGVLIPL